MHVVARAQKFLTWSFLFLLLGTAACVKQSGNEELATQPVSISGKGIVASFDNSRVRCAQKSAGGEGRYEIQCLVAAMENGNESIAESLAPGLKITWLDPSVLDNGIVDVISCRRSSNGLQNTCDVTLPSTAPTKVEFAARLDEGERSRPESDIVHFPYVVRSYGLVAENPLSFAVTDTTKKISGGGAARSVASNMPRMVALQSETTEEQLAEPMGYQSPGLPSMEIVLQFISGVCARGKKVFFSAGNYVYEWNESATGSGTVRIFAGSTNQSNPMDLTSRLRISLRGQLFLLCQVDGILVAEKDYSRILKIPDEGPIELIAGNGLSTQGTTRSPDGTPALEAQLTALTGVAIGPDGMIYFGDNSQTVRKLRRDPTAGLVLQTVYTSAPGSSMGQIAVGPDGSIIIADTYMGPTRRVSPEGTVTELIPSNNGIGNFVFGPEGSLYASSHRGFIYHVSSMPDGQALLTPIGGTGQPSQLFAGTTAGDGGHPLQAKFNAPSVLAFDSEGSLIIADSGHRLVRRITKPGTAEARVSTLAGALSADVWAIREGDPALTARFTALSAVAFLPDGSMLAADEGSGRIWRVAKGADSVERMYLFAGTGSRLVTEPVGAQMNAIDAPLGMITDMVASPSGHIYVAYREATSGTPDGRIARIDPDGKLTIIARQRGLAGIAMGPDGSLYVGSGVTSVPVRRFRPKLDSSGNALPLDHTVVPEAIASGGSMLVNAAVALDPLIQKPATSLLLYAEGITVDRAGNVFLGDRSNSVVYKLAGGVLYLVAGQVQNTQNMNSPDGTLGRQAGFYYPIRMKADDEGNVYVLDRGPRGQLRVLRPTADPVSYTVDHFFGGPAKDCGNGVIEGAAQSEKGLDEAFRASLAVMCASGLRGFDFREVSLADGSHRFLFAIAQSFNTYISENQPSGNILRLERPAR